MKTIIRGTTENGEVILIGLPSVISIERLKITRGSETFLLTKIQSRGAMVSTHYVIETVEEIYNLINN